MELCKRNSLSLKGFVCLCIVLILIQCLVSRKVQAAEFEEIQKLWNEEKYMEVIDRLIKYREGLGGKNVIVDFMLATSCCRIKGMEDLGVKYFNWAQHNYTIDEVTIGEISDEMLNSLSEQPKKPKRPRFVIAKVGSGRAGTEGKIYHILENPNKAVIHERIKVLNPIPIEKFKQRLFFPSQKERAMQAVSYLVEGRFMVASSDHFILASSSRGLSRENLEQICKDMEKSLKFFVRQYDMPVPPYFITVYLVPDTSKMVDLAHRIHGLGVSRSCIGYYYQDDFSIVAVIHRMVYGTLLHELFHLMVRGNFGDIPPWLGEGMAALYETCKIERDNTIKGVPNWRGKIIKETGTISIENLVKMNARTFNNPEHDWGSIQQAINHATARYFVLYLQEKQKLVEVYKALRDRKIKDMKVDPGTDAVKIIEEILGKKDLSEVDREFREWFQKIPKHGS